MFTVLAIEQSSPIWMVESTMTVSLVTNCDLAAGSIVTLSGLTGSDTTDGSVGVSSEFAGSG
eukprot:2956355-Rhodomonas_salina.1